MLLILLLIQLHMSHKVRKGKLSILKIKRMILLMYTLGNAHKSTVTEWGPLDAWQQGQGDREVLGSTEGPGETSGRNGDVQYLGCGDGFMGVKLRQHSYCGKFLKMFLYDFKEEDVPTLMGSDCNGVWGGHDNRGECCNHIVFSCETFMSVYQ